MRDFLFQFGNQGLDARALQVCLRSAEIARNYRKIAFCGVFGDVFFSTVSQWSDHGVTTVSRTKLRRHRLQRTDIKQIEEESGDYVVGVMSECDFVTAFLDGDVVQNPSTQPRTDRTVGF